MDLRIALLLLGLGIIVLIGLTALDRARASRLFRLRSRTSQPPGEKQEPAVPGPGPAFTLDIHPRPPTDENRKVLGTDAAVAPLPRREDAGRKNELQTLEEVATMPLNLDLGIEHAKRGRPAPRGPRQPDERIDFVVTLSGEQSVARDAALGIWKQNEYLLEKPHFLFGKRTSDGQWSELAHDSSRTIYSDLVLAIQMVDARGPLDVSELNTFAQIGLKLADALNRRTRFSAEFDDTVLRAKRLHAFCDAFDVIASVNVVAEAPATFPGRAIEQTARRLGLQFGAMSIFHMKNGLSPGCKHLFSMANLFQPGAFDAGAWDRLRTSGLTLFMSVPCAYNPVAVFDKMVDTARGLCTALGGSLRDQEGKPLSERGVEVIRGQIAEIEAKMRAQDIVPGSETALRLFRTFSGAIESSD
jgi:cell division protein ZipA